MALLMKNCFKDWSQSIKEQPCKSLYLTEYFQTVYVKANFLKVSDINTIKEEFLADVVVAVRWRESSLDHTKVMYHFNL